MSKSIAKPQDHKQKQVKPKVTKSTKTIDGREVDGFEVEHAGVTVFVNREAFDDFEFLDDLANLENQRAQRMPMMLRRLIGEQDFRAVMNALRDKKTGRTSIESGTDYIRDLLQAVNPNG